MARINGIRSGRARLVFSFVRRGMAKLTGTNAAGVIEPLQMYAHVPALLAGYVKLERATAGLHGIDPRLRALAELKAATLTHCAYCIDLGSAIAHRWGLTDDELLALPGYPSSPLFSDLDKLVLDYAVAMSSTPAAVPDALFAGLRKHFSPAQLVELTHHIALENMRGRFNLALGIGPAGVSEGTVCAAPAVHCGQTAGGSGSAEGTPQ